MLNIEDICMAEIDESLNEIESGIFLQRIRNGCLDEPSNVFLTADQDYLMYANRKKSKYRFDGDKRLPISEILEIRSGWRTDNFQKLSSDPKFCKNVLESRCFSIIFRHPVFLIKSLDFVAQTTEMQDHFVNGLRYLVNKIKKEIHYFNEEKWLKEQFIKADKNKNGTLSFKEVWNLLSYLNLELDEKQAKRLFQQADLHKNDERFGEDSLDFDEFLIFFRSLTQRTELKWIMSGYSQSKKEYFTIEDLKNFVENVQKRPPISDHECQQILDTFEPELPNKIAKILSVTGFLKYLLSYHGDIFDPAYGYVYQDMNRPLNEYWIMSSHNTYLLGHQLKGDASIEAYFVALKKGVRTLEMDIWDSSPEPVITHGHTLVNPIRLRDATKIIDQYAFVTSNYPVMLSLEVHCTVKNQRLIADIFQEIFGDKLYIIKNDDQSSLLPSPEDLKGKIMLKGFKIPASVKESVWTPNEKEFSSAQFDPDHELHKTVEDRKADESEKQRSIAKELSDLIALPILAIKDIKRALDIHPYNAVANFSEKKLPDLDHPMYESYLTYARRHLIRIYPFGLRTDSSNLNPLRFWQAGMQTVSLNVQHADLSNDLNDALFKLNGNCGYILKPAILREGNFQQNKVQNWSKRTIVRIQVISAQYLPRPKADNDIIDPYVLLQVHGLDCDSTSFRTNYIKNNGFNPFWNENFDIALRAPEFAFIRFVIFDRDKFSSDDFIAEYTIPAVAMRQGYSYLHMRTGYMHSVDPSAALLVYITKEQLLPDELEIDRFCSKPK